MSEKLSLPGSRLISVLGSQKMNIKLCSTLDHDLCVCVENF